jgi:hypothetical protein
MDESGEIKQLPVKTLRTLLDKVKKEVVSKDRTHRLRTHPNSFVGMEHVRLRLVASSVGMNSRHVFVCSTITVWSLSFDMLIESCGHWSGSDAVGKIAEIGNVDRERAVEIGQQMLEIGFLKFVVR